MYATTTMQSLLEAGNVDARRTCEGPGLRETSRGPAPVRGWQPIVDRRSENQLKREGLVLRPTEKVCHRCWTTISVTGECYC